MSNEGPRFDGLQVLLVEDEPGLREAFAIILELEGCTVACASDGREALQQLQFMRPDIIVSDYMMPRMNGAELVKYIRAKPELADIPILLLSAALPRQIGASIADDFLPKPVSAAALLSAIASLTSGKTA